MKKVLFIILGIIFITSCGEVIPKPDPSPQPQPDPKPRLEEPAPPTNPTYTESCSDIPEQAELENAEANPYEIWMACLIKNHPEQGRPTMSYHPLLGAVARARADDIALNGLSSAVGHVDSHGFGPNYYVCLIGYDANFCPAGAHDNSVESLSGGEDPDAVLLGWLNSPGHKIHVLAQDEYFAGQLYYGIGFGYVTFPPDYTDGGGVYIFIAAHPPVNGELD